jgi:predicted DNA-binding transcriptional regulator AlpA
MSDKGNELDMLTAQQVRDLTGVPISTLHDWASKRERGIEAPGPHHLRLSDRHRRWARRDVVAWLNAARISPDDHARSCLSDRRQRSRALGQ